MINRKLKARIVEKYGTQVDFATKLGLHETYVSRIINGRRKLDAKDQRKWAMALGCQPEDIFPNWRDD